MIAGVKRRHKSEGETAGSRRKKGAASVQGQHRMHEGENEM